MGVVDGLVKNYRIQYLSRVVSYWIEVFIVFNIRFFLWIFAHVLNAIEFNAKWKTPQKLPPIESNLCKISVSKMSELLMTKQITSRQLLEAYIDRIKLVDKILNGVVEDRFDEALKEADQVDQWIRGISKQQVLTHFKDYPLCGIPFTVKETLGVKGMKHSSARTRVPPITAIEDAEAVGMLRKAGAIPLLTSNAPELCLNIETVSKHGRTLNPYDTTRSTGGSSGGEGALLGAGASPFGIASDIAGSIRIPAMFCGVYAHKPTPGLVSVQGHIPGSSDNMWEYYFTAGPMVRKAVDLPLILKTITSPDLVKSLRLDEKVAVSSLKVYYMMGEGNESVTQTPPSHRMRRAMERAVETLRERYNCTCEEIHLPYLVDGIKYNRHIVTMKGIENVYQRSEDPDDWDFKRALEVLCKKATFKTDANVGAMFWAPMKFMSELAQKIGPKDAEWRLKCFREQFGELLGDNAVFLYPPFSVEAQPHNILSSHALNVGYSSIFNVLGVPATQCPVRVEGSNLPVGVQVVAGRDQDRLCFAVAAALEETCGGWVPPE